MGFTLHLDTARPTMACQVSIFSLYRPTSPSKEVTETPENKRMEA